MEPTWISDARAELRALTAEDERKSLAAPSLPFLFFGLAAAAVGCAAPAPVSAADAAPAKAGNTVEGPPRSAPIVAVHHAPENDSRRRQCERAISQADHDARRLEILFKALDIEHGKYVSYLQQNTYTTDELAKIARARSSIGSAIIAASRPARPRSSPSFAR